MIKIKVPATSANLGPGFDTLGIALNIYNEFYFEKSDDLIIENVEEKYKNRNNLLIKAYDITLAKRGLSSGLYVKFETNIPISRGLGSSSSLIVAGVMAANYLHNLSLSQQEVLEICNEIEGHPDNVAPCLFGGLVTSMVKKGIPYSKKLEVNKKFCFTLMIPNFEVKTSKAREVMPEYIKVEDAIFSLSRAISLCYAFQDGNEEYLKVALEDRIHEPYRKNLIPDYEKLKEEVLKNDALGMVISGSGSTCLVISKDVSFSKRLNLSKLKLDAKWDLIDCEIHNNEVRIEEF